MIGWFFSFFMGQLESESSEPVLM